MPNIKCFLLNKSTSFLDCISQGKGKSILNDSRDLQVMRYLVICAFTFFTENILFLDKPLLNYLNKNGFSSVFCKSEFQISQKSKQNIKKFKKIRSIINKCRKHKLHYLLSVQSVAVLFCEY